jgi:hypothetical protein
VIPTPTPPTNTITATTTRVASGASEPRVAITHPTLFIHKISFELKGSMRSGQFGFSQHSFQAYSRRYRIRKKLRLGLDQISKTWSPLLWSLQAEKDTVLGDFLLLLIDW